MKLTTEEARFVERLRRSESWWPVKRWFFLAWCVAMFLIPILLRRDDNPLFQVFPLAAAYVLSYVFTNWRGRMRNQIFIKLAEHVQSQSNHDA